jgi:nucleoid DNA-binding protein
MKLTDLVDHVASEAGIEKGAARRAVDAVFAGIVEAAKKVRRSVCQRSASSR